MPKFLAMEFHPRKKIANLYFLIVSLMQVGVLRALAAGVAGVSSGGGGVAFCCLWVGSYSTRYVLCSSPTLCGSCHTKYVGGGGGGMNVPAALPTPPFRVPALSSLFAAEHTHTHTHYPVPVLGIIPKPLGTKQSFQAFVCLFVLRCPGPLAPNVFSNVPKPSPPAAQVSNLVCIIPDPPPPY